MVTGTYTQVFPQLLYAREDSQFLTNAWKQAVKQQTEFHSSNRHGTYKSAKTDDNFEHKAFLKHNKSSPYR